MREIPLALARFCSRLQVLNFSNNNLSNLPDNLKNLKQLTKLDVSENSINMVEELPAKLNSIHLSNNLIETLPP